MTAASASAPGNLFLVGEYGALYGSPALVVAPERRSSAICETVDHEVFVLETEIFGTITARTCGLRADDQPRVPPEVEPLIGLVRSQAESLLPSGNGLRVSIKSDLPIGAGMSSSSAVLASIAAAVGSVLKETADLESLRSAILPRQVEVHGGAASGVELWSTLYGGAHWVDGENAVALPPHLPRFLVADSGTRRRTAKAPRQRGSTSPFLQGLASCADEQLRAWREGDWSRLGHCLSLVHGLLDGIGASTPRLNAIVDTATGSGAWGAKLSGAGLGGVAVILGPEEALPEIARAVKRSGATSICELDVAGSGVEVSSGSSGCPA